MKKKRWILLLALVLLCTACSQKQSQADSNATPSPNFSGTYTDRQGSSEICSALDLSRNEDGTYSFFMSIYRLTALEGTAEYQNGQLHFICDSPYIEGDIVIHGTEAEVTITASEFSYIQAADVFRFPDGAADSPQ